MSRQGIYKDGLNKNQNIKVRVDDNMREWIDEYCQENKGISMSDIIRESLKLFKNKKGLLHRQVK